MTERKTEPLVPENEPYLTDDVPLDDVRENTLRPLIYVCVLIAFGMAALGFVARVPEYIKTRFTLKSDVRELIYQFDEAVTVESVSVSVGQPVTRGEPLIRITSPVILKRISALRDAQEVRERFESQESRIHESRIGEKDLDLSRIEGDIAEAKRRLRAEERSYAERMESIAFDEAEAERKIKQNRELLKQGFISPSQLAEVEQEANAVRERKILARQEHENELARLNSRIRQLELDEQAGRLDRERLEQEYRKRREELQYRVEQAKQAIRDHYREAEILGGTLLLKAPLDGTVSYLYSGDSRLETGSALLKILGEGTSLHANASIDAGRMGRLATGQTVVLKVDSFPHYQFGVLHGKVKSVSLTPDEKGLVPFTVAIIDAGRLEDRLQVGMTGNLSVVVGQQRFFGMLFHRIQKGYYETLE